MIHPMGRKLLLDAIEDAAASSRGPCYADEMVTIVSNDDGSLTIRKFSLTDIGNGIEQFEFLRDVLLEECPVKPWTHPYKPNKYPHGTGYGRAFLENVLSRNGCPEPGPIFDRMLTDGDIRYLGRFDASAGGSFDMFAAVPDRLPVGSTPTTTDDKE